MMAALGREPYDGHRHHITQETTLSFFTQMMEECEEVEEETGGFRLELDLSDVTAVHRDLRVLRNASGARNFRSSMLRFNHGVPLYTAIHSFLI